MSKFPTFKLTDKQIRGIANVVLHEQGTIAGWFAEASQIANICEIKYDNDPVKAVASKWYAHGKDRYAAGTSNTTVINIVKRVLLDGFRTLPRYIDEHDCMSDIKSVTEGGKGVKSKKDKWVPHSTVIKNRMGSTYTFYDFPGGYNTNVDPFGYTSKELREKYGDFCYTVEQAQKKEDLMSEPIKKIISIAEAEVGYLEKRSNKNLDNKTSNAGSSNYTKYGKWIGANGDYWCAAFLSWIFYKAFGTEMGKKLLCGSYSAACETIRQNFKKHDQYKSSPKAGDVIFFKGTRHAGANHIGLVRKVDNGKVYTIEGNTSGASDVVDNGGGVAKKNYSLNNSKILGYGRPNYIEKDATQKTKPQDSYYKKYTGNSKSIVDALKSIGVEDTSIRNRQLIAEKNGIKNYSGMASQNLKLLNLLKAGKLKK